MIHRFTPARGGGASRDLPDAEDLSRQLDAERRECDQWRREALAARRAELRRLLCEMSQPPRMLSPRTDASGIVRPMSHPLS